MRCGGAGSVEGEQKSRLEAYARGRRTAARLVLRALIVLLACEAKQDLEIAAMLGVVTRDREYLELSRKATRELLAHATDDAKGTSWAQVENRVEPDVAVAQTGYMQGASGIGMWLLNMSESSRGKRKPAIVFPDNPFAY